MGIEANGTSGITSVVANGVTMDTVIANGVEVFSAYDPWQPIQLGYDLTDLSNQGFTTTDISSTFYTDATYGMGWGTNDNVFKELVIPVPSGATGYTIVTTGEYNNPTGGLGWLHVYKNDGTTAIYDFYDAWTNDATGQSLAVNGSFVFNQSQTNLYNDSRSGSLASETANIKINMKGYTASYGYTKRYIKSLTFT